MNARIIPLEVLAYCAGVIDSDGSIRVRKQQNRVSGSYRYTESVRVKQREKEAVELLSSVFGGHVTIEKRATYCDMTAWTVEAKKAHACLVLLLPFLRIKHAQAVNALRLRPLVERSKSCRLVAHVRMPRPQDITLEMVAIHERATVLNAGPQ